MDDKIQHIYMNTVDIPEQLIRTQVDEAALIELAKSIEEVGLLQPIVVKEKGKRFELIAGLRRYMAHQWLERPSILAVIKPKNFKLSDPATLVENIQRENLPLMDEAQAVRNLVDTQGIGMEAAAKLLGKSRPWVRMRLDLLRLEADIAEHVQAGKISMGAAFELSKIADPAMRQYYTNYAITGGVTTDQAKRWREQADLDEQLKAGVPMQYTDVPEPEPIHTPTILCFSCDQVHPVNFTIAVRICDDCMPELVKLKHMAQVPDEELIIGPEDLDAGEHHEEHPPGR